MAHQPRLTAGLLLLRLVRALLPVVSLYIGKLIIDDVVRLVAMPARPVTFHDWMTSGQLAWLGALLLAEFALAVLSDVLGSVVSLLDCLLSERVTNLTSVRLMEHAATLDLEDFEDAEFQDQLERARRQASGRLTLMGQLFSQAQDMVTVASFAAGLVVYAPWLIVLLRSRWCRRSSARRTSTRRPIRSISAARRSGASSTTCARPPPASRPPRK